MEIVRKHQQIKVSNEYDVQLKRLYPADGLQTPFGSAHVTLDAGKRSRPHKHHEHETFIILRGSGHFVQADKQVPVAQGDVLYIKPHSEHYLEADTSSNIEFISIWWESKAQAHSIDLTKYVIFTPPPTPNGDLHLGHICGPYIAADVISRQLRQHGKHAHLVVGTDKNQSYVDLKARQREIPAIELFHHYSESIMQTFNQANIDFDSIYDCDSLTHRPFVHDFMQHLQLSKVLHLRPEICAWCESCDVEVFDAFARGVCPHCASPSNGCVCEDCGSSNNSHDLNQLRCNLCGTSPRERTAIKAVLDIQACKRYFAEANLKIGTGGRLRSYLKHQDQLPAQDFVVSFFSNWGITGLEPALVGQTLLVWIEMAAAYLAAIYKGTFDEDPRSVGEAISRLNQAEVEVIHLMGFDNSFYYAYLYPKVLAAIGLKNLKINFVVNEFLLLDHSKFSTSRNHAIWAKDVFSDHQTTDWYRFYLSVKRPEDGRENYEQEGFEKFRCDTEQSLRQLATLQRKRLHAFNEGKSPVEGGSWTREHEEYSLFFEQHLYNSLTAPGSYSVKQFATNLINLIKGIQRFQDATLHHYNAEFSADERRTSLYLEVSALNGLRQRLSCLMPTVTKQLLG